MRQINTHEKNNGIFYTPSKLADFVADLTISSANSKVLDPCYGEGSLLLAARERLHELGSIMPDRQLFGYDIATLREDIRMNCLHGLLDEKNLEKRDFLLRIGHKAEASFDVVLMNPPFVRHHLIPKKYQKRMRNIVGNDANLPMTSDLWAYFIVHSLKFIREKGCLGAILPWAFLYTDFAERVRELLHERFRVIRVVVIGQRMFEKAEERILVLIGSEFRFPTSEIGFYYSSGIPKKKISWRPIEQKIWRASPWMCLVNSDIHEIISRIGDRIGLEPLGRFANVRIGTVTGANKFFILTRESAKAMRIPKSILKPIITHSKNLRTLVIPNSEGIRDVLMAIPEAMKLSRSLKVYIKMGETNDVNKRYHTRKRVKWYSIPHLKAPDGFFHYMTKEVPFIALNSEGILSTNTVHQVVFLNEIDENTKKWIQFSMLTSISQLSAELVGRTYGGGVLKIEPTAASKILVYSGNGYHFPSDLGNKLNNLLLKGKRREAMELADEWMIANLRIPRKDMNAIMECYRDLRDLRLGEYADEKRT